MKTLFITLIFALIGFSESHAQYNVTVSNVTDDLVTMRCIGYGKKADIATTDAELSAIKTLIFHGADGVKRCLPLIKGDKSSVEKKFSKEFKNLYENDFKDFISSSVIVTQFGKNSLKKKCITLDISVRIKQLRTYLENKGVIRKFGF